MIRMLEKISQNGLGEAVTLLREHLRNPLYTNAYLLILNQGLSAVMGFVYWMVAARSYSAEQVGKSSAIISTLVFVSVLAEFSLKSGMQRYVPRAGHQVRKLIVLTYAINLLLTGLFTVGFFALGSALHFSDSLFGGMATRSLALLVLATMLWTIFLVQDGVLMGLRQTLWVLLENSFYNLSKIILLIIGISGILGDGIVASWFIPVPLVVLVVNSLVLLRFIPLFLKREPTPVEPLKTRQVITSVTGDHAGTILSETSIRLLPLMVINLVGSSANAYFYQAWLIGTMIYLVSYNMTASFTVEVAPHLDQLAYYSRQTVRHMMLLITPVALLLLGAAPLILGIYGGEYARQGSPLLRLLAIAAFPYSFNSWFLSYARVRVDNKAIIWNQGLQGVITLGLSYWWMPHFGIVSVGLAWLIGQTVTALPAIILTRIVLFGKEIPQPQHDPVQPVLRSGDTALSEQGNRDVVQEMKDSLRLHGTGPVYLFLSPHLDDVMLSCGGYVSRLASAGEQVVVVSICTDDLPEGWPVSWLARRNLRAWGLESTPFAARRREDEAAAQELGVETIHLGLFDAMYRCRPGDGPGVAKPYYLHNTVGVPLDPDDEMVTGSAITTALNQVVSRLPESTDLRVFSPLGAGGHIDHLLLRRKAEGVFGLDKLTYYEEYPYAYRAKVKPQPSQIDSEPTSSAWELTKIKLSPEEIEARIAAVGCYSSQIPGLFPTVFDRYLEIVAARVPIVGEGIWKLYKEMRTEEKMHERMARMLRKYIAEVGGESYWQISSTQR